MKVIFGIPSKAKSEGPKEVIRFPIPDNLASFWKDMSLHKREGRYVIILNLGKVVGGYPFVCLLIDEHGNRGSLSRDQELQLLVSTEQLVFEPLALIVESTDSAPLSLS